MLCSLHTVSDRLGKYPALGAWSLNTWTTLRDHFQGPLIAPLFYEAVKTGCFLAYLYNWVMCNGAVPLISAPINCVCAIFRITDKNLATTWLQFWFGSKTLLKKACFYLCRFSRWRNCKLRVAELEVSWQHHAVYPLYTKHRSKLQLMRVTERLSRLCLWFSFIIIAQSLCNHTQVYMCCYNKNVVYSSTWKTFCYVNIPTC